MKGEHREERRRDVLRAVVRAFVASAEPVGSRSIAGDPGCEVSPATLRNVMAELEQLGFLRQPHHSAGRVPTADGFRRYAELLLAERARKPAPALSVLDEEVTGAAELKAVLLEVSRALARRCGCVGVVLHPQVARCRFQHLSFLRLERGRVVVVVVGDGGVVADRRVQVEEDLAQDDLDRISSYLVNRFQGWTLLEVQRTLALELSEEQAAYDRARRQWLQLALATLERAAGSDEIYLDGAARCLESPEFGDLGQLRELLRAYEEKGKITALLGRCLERADLTVSIGCAGEDPANDLPDGLALVAAVYGEAGRPLGSLGVLGPARMEYERVIAVVDAAARELSRALAHGLPAEH